MSERKAFPLRIDAELYEELRSWAEQEMRSVNGQIEYLLRQAVQARRGTSKNPSGSGQSQPPHRDRNRGADRSG